MDGPAPSAPLGTDAGTGFEPAQLRFGHIASVTVLAAGLATSVLFASVGATERLLATVPFCLVGAGTRLLFALGRPRAAFHLLLLGAWGCASAGMLWGQGVFGPSVGGVFVLVALLSAWVLGERVCIALMGASTVVLFAMAIASALALPLPRNVPVPAWVAAGVISGIVFIAGMLGMIAMRIFRSREARLATQLAEIRRQQLELESVQGRFEAMFRAGPTPAAISGGDGRGIVDCNEAFCRLIGRERKDTLGRTGRELGYWADPRELERCRDQLKHDGAVRGFRTVFTRSNGEPRRVVLDTQRIALEDGQEGILWQAVDVTSEHAARAALEELNADLERRVDVRTAELRTAIEELDSFSYSVAHDLNAPLRAINGRASLVMEGAGEQLGEEERAQLDRIRESTTRMAELIEDLLELSRVTRARLEVQPVDLSAVAQSVAAELETGEPGRHVHWRIAPGLSVRADPGLMRSLLANLIGNAWKYTRDRAEAVIEVESAPDADGMKSFRVRDNGIGFDPAEAGNLFKPFVRLHADARFEGTGIGLAAVARIVSRHGGTVSAQGTPGVGTIVEFRIPP